MAEGIQEISPRTRNGLKYKISSQSMKIARNARSYKNVTTMLSLQLNPNMNEAMADLKSYFPPLIMSPIQRTDPFFSKTSSLKLQKPLSHCLLQNNAVSSMDCAVGDDGSVASCHWYEIEPGNPPCSSSNE